MGTKNNPGDFDCYAKALPDEPMFTLLGRDPNAPKCIQEWARDREIDIERGLQPASDRNMTIEARRCAADMREWRVVNDGAWRNDSAPSLDILLKRISHTLARLHESAGAVPIARIFHKQLLSYHEQLMNQCQLRQEVWAFHEEKKQIISDITKDVQALIDAATTLGL